MILQSMINSLSKTDDFIKMINLLSETNDFIKIDEFANKKWKGVKSDKIKVFPLVCSKYLSSWTGPDMTEVRVLVQFGMFRVQKWYFEKNSR